MRRTSNVLKYVVLLLLLSTVVTAEPKPSSLHIVQIAKIEAMRSPGEKDLYKLAVHHYRLGQYYAAIAHCTALLTIKAARCYSEDKVREWGAEYFGVLSALQLGNLKEARAIASSSGKRRGAPPVLISLRKIVGRAVTRLSKGEMLTIDGLNPANYPDSMEAISLIQYVSNRGLPNITKRDLKNKDGVSLEALSNRLKLSQLISNSDVNALGRFVKELDTKLLPVWEIKTTDGTARFSDPMLTMLLSKAHFILANGAFRRIHETSEKMKDRKLLNWIRTTYRLGYVDRVDSLLKLSRDDVLLQPYQGWVYRSRGNNAKAEKVWGSVASSDKVTVATELLGVLAEYPDENSLATKIRTRLIHALGGLHERAELNKSTKGRNQMFKTYWAVGDWFYKHKVYDSAAYYFGFARVGNNPVSLDEYPPLFCASYFSARIMSGSTDFQQEGYQGFLDLQEYYPSAAVVIEPLSTVLQCESIKLRE